MSEVQYTGSDLGHSNITALHLGGFNKATVQSLTITGNGYVNSTNVAGRADYTVTTGLNSSKINGAGNTRDSDTAVESGSKNVILRHNKIFGFHDAGVYVSGKEINGMEVSGQLTVQNNDFFNNTVAIVAKRGFNKTKVMWNEFRYNNTDVGFSFVGGASSNSYPGKQSEIFGNVAYTTQGSFFDTQ